MKKVFIVNGSYDYFDMFRELGFTIVDDLYKADLCVFTGGEDVSPHLYGDQKHPLTHNSVARDEYEQSVFEQCQDNSIPCVGICRGGQFLNVMSGGRMYQHVSNHCGVHDIVDARTGETLQVTSTHHQMFLPSSEAVVVAYSTLGGTREWYTDVVFHRDVSDIDYEVLFYPKTRCLCFQPHPEFSGFPAMRTYFKKLVDDLLTDFS